MNGYILDTDTWIEFFHHRGGVADHIADTPANKIFASEISIAELTYGALHSKDVQRHLSSVITSHVPLRLSRWFHMNIHQYI